MEKVRGISHKRRFTVVSVTMLENLTSKEIFMVNGDEGRKFKLYFDKK
jgi:hypothetical protein